MKNLKDIEIDLNEVIEFIKSSMSNNETVSIDTVIDNLLGLKEEKILESIKNSVRKNFKNHEALNDILVVIEDAFDCSNSQTDLLIKVKKEFNHCDREFLQDVLNEFNDPGCET
jgi:hypothetical protein